MPLLPQQALAGVRMWRAEPWKALSGNMMGTAGRDGADPNTSILLGACQSVAPIRPLRVGSKMRRGGLNYGWKNTRFLVFSEEIFQIYLHGLASLIMN